MIHRISVCVWIYIISLGGLYAQSEVSGQVVDLQGGAIPGVTVQIKDKEYGTVTDAKGRFFFPSVPHGSYTLLFRFMGFSSRQYALEVPGKPVAVALESNSLNMEEFVVTGTLSPRFVSQSPIKVEVMTSEYFNTFMPSAATSLVEGIALTNGVQETVSCGVCFTNSLSINGLPGPYTAILMDGTPIYGNLASVYGLNGIPSMIIDRIEVIKGPSSTLYGSEAVAGVINVITKDPKDQPMFSADVMGTSHLESFGNFSLAPKVGNSHGYLGLNYAYINDFDDENGDGFGDNINLDRVSLFAKWEVARPSNKLWSLAAKYYYEDRRNGVEAFLNDRNYQNLRGSDSIYGESIYTHRLEFFGSYVFNTTADLRVDYSASTHKQDSYYGADHYTADQTIGFTNLIWTKSLGGHRLTSGLTNRYQLYDDNTVATQQLGGSVNKPDEQLIPGLFVQDEWQVSGQWTLLGGARLDQYKRHGWIFSPRVNAKWKLSDWTSLRTNFGTGFRIVNLFTEDHAFVTGQREVMIVESLAPESSYNTSFNLNHVYNLGSGQGMLDVDVFYTYFMNKIIPDYDTPGAIIYANTRGYAVSKGLGINVSHDFGLPIHVNIGANYQEVTETETVSGTKETTAIEFAPRWSGVLTTNYEWSRWNLSLAYTAQYTGVMALPEVFDVTPGGTVSTVSRPQASTPFSVHHLQITKLLKRLKLYGGIQNMFDYRQPGSPLVGYNDPGSNPGFSDQFDTSYAFAPIHGREFYLGMAWTVGG